MLKMSKMKKIQKDFQNEEHHFLFKIKLYQYLIEFNIYKTDFGY